MIKIIYQLNKHKAIATSQIQDASLLLVQFFTHPVYNGVHYSFAKPNFSNVTMVPEVFKFQLILMIPAAQRTIK